MPELEDCSILGVVLGSAFADAIALVAQVVEVERPRCPDQYASLAKAVGNFFKTYAKWRWVKERVSLRVDREAGNASAAPQNTGPRLPRVIGPCTECHVSGQRVFRGST